MFGEIKKHLHRLKLKHQSHGWDEEKSSKLLNFYVRTMAKALDAERCSIFINDPEHGKVWLKAGLDVVEHQIEVPTEGSVVGEVISSGKHVLLTDLQNQEGPHRDVDKETGFETREILCVPITSTDGSEVTGAIEVLNKRDGQFSDRDRRTLEELAYYLQLQIEHIFLNQEVIGISEGIYNAARELVYVAGGTVGLMFVLLIGYLIFMTGATAVLSGH